MAPGSDGDWIYPLASFTWDKNEVGPLQDVMSAGRQAKAEKVLEFESVFWAEVWSKDAFMSNSGGSANFLSLTFPALTRLCGFPKDGAEVIASEDS
jgi:dTDP-4-amino-4,6-dideoxygalactose transaminase